MGDWRDTPEEQTGIAVIKSSHPLIGFYSTQWVRDLRKWTYQARKAEALDELRKKLHEARLTLEYFSDCLADSDVGKRIAKRRKTAEANARYVPRNGKRIYVGKRKTDEIKRRRAAAARTRRAKKRGESHGAICATPPQLLASDQ